MRPDIDESRFRIGGARLPIRASRKAGNGDDAFALGSADQAASDVMQAAIAERLPEIVLTPVADYLLHG